MRKRMFRDRTEYRRQYNHARWQDPAFRDRHRVIARESARRKRERKRQVERETFPFGYRAPGWFGGDKLVAHFMDFVQERFQNPVLTHACFEHRFDPTTPDAAAKWALLVSAVTELCEGFNPVTGEFEEKTNHHSNEQA